VKRRYLISSDEAVETKGQCRKPCSDCPWSRQALPGWLGSNTREEWIAIAHGEFRVDCHTRKNNECAGLAIYRANVCKSVRDPSVLVLPADRDAVFARPQEFLDHHEKVGRPPAKRRAGGAQ
jgi:hypothetical protein